MMVGRLLSFWDGIFSVAMLNFQGVIQGKGVFSGAMLVSGSTFQWFSYHGDGKCPKEVGMWCVPSQMAMNMAFFGFLTTY